jgi:ketosteroid isomerase-like protein
LSTDLQEFEQFMKRREAASAAYVQGDAEPFNQVVAQACPATFFPPMGGFARGTEDVAARYSRDAKAFETGSHFTFEILQMAASDGIAYWVGFMKGEAHMRGKPEAIPMSLRITEVFRREGDAWKIVHRHADPMAEPTR